MCSSDLHGGHSVNLPLADVALPTVITNEDESTTLIPPTRAACTSCHDSLFAKAHAAVNVDTVSGVEACAVCHGASADFAVATVHALTP